MKKLIIKNSFYSLLDLIITILISILIPKIFVLGMDMELYGLFITLTLFSSYGILTMIDFGMGGAIVVFAARYFSTDKNKLNRLWTFSFIYYFIVSLFAIIIALLIINCYDLNIKNKLIELNISISILIPTLILIGFGFLSYFGDSFLLGFNDYKFLKLFSIIQNFIRFILIFIIIKYVKKIEPIIWITSVLSILKFFITVFYINKKYHELRIFNKLKLNEVKEWFRYSIILMISNINGFAFNYFNRILITIYLPISDMGNFDVISKPQKLIHNISTSLTSTIIPISSHYSAINEKEKIIKIFTNGSFWSNLLVMPTVIFITIFMKDIFNIWLSSKYSELYFYAQILMISFFTFHLTANLANMIIVGIGKAQKIISLQVLGSILTIILEFLGIYYYGFKGIVIAYSIGTIFITIGYILITNKILNIDWFKFKNQFLIPNLKIIIPSLVLVFIIKLLSFNINLIMLIMLFILYSLILYSYYYIYLINQEEKEFLHNSFEQIVSKIKVTFNNFYFPE
jgi:O-antigen/teichoic acid export membrane protein